MPVGQQGFRNLLAGMYVHTGAHITAAPMAHYLATSPEQSRYRYSHDSANVQAYALEKYLLNEPLTMRFRYATNKSRTAYHPFMDYVFRPTAVAHMCSYQCALRVRTTGKTKDTEYFEFLPEHPFRTKDCVVYNNAPTVPCLAWNFLPHTASFSTSLLSPVDTSAPDYMLKEKYARRFMILFLPFRTLADLLEDGSYLRRLQTAIAQHEIASDMLDIADNIQNIHNSLQSEMVENLLTCETSLPESAEFSQEEEEDEDENTTQLLQQIGNLLAPSSAAASITEEPVSFCPRIQTCKNSMDTLKAETVVFPKLEDVFVDSNNGSEPTSTPGTSEIPKYKYKAKTSTLNQLVMKRFLQKENINPSNDNTEENMDLPSNNWKVTATGSWESIVAWGRKANLDNAQQTAFQIMAATFVLTFLDDMDIDETVSNLLHQQKTWLQRLARIDRQPRTRTGPTRLFVTGPAGAGKCKFVLCQL